MSLALAYTPGVACACEEIHANPENAYIYTTKGNLVAVISNGTAVLGLGNIGAQASKPVMEAKAFYSKNSLTSTFSIWKSTNWIRTNCAISSPLWNPLSAVSIWKTFAHLNASILKENCVKK